MIDYEKANIIIDPFDLNGFVTYAMYKRTENINTDLSERTFVLFTNKEAFKTFQKNYESNSMCPSITKEDFGKTFKLCSMDFIFIRGY